MCETIETLNKIETETCSRCGGSGSYSYCQQYGTTCFKCRGRKIVMTARGYEANRYLEQLRSRPAEEIKVGDVVKDPYDYWMRVDSIESAKQEGAYTKKIDGAYQMVPYSLDVLRISGVDAKTGKEAGGMQVEPHTAVRVHHAGPAAAATWAAAMEYQATLNKWGRPQK